MTAYNRHTLLVGLAAAILIGGILSYFASANPDGLEKTQEDLGVAEAPHGGLDAPAVAFDGYNLKWLGDGFWANAGGGIIGSLLVMGLLLGLGRLMKRGRGPSAARGGPSSPHA